MQLTPDQFAQVAVLARRRYGATAMGPYLSQVTTSRDWRAHVFIVVKGNCTRVLYLEPFDTHTNALKALMSYLASNLK